MKINKIKPKRLDSKTLKAMYESKTVELVEIQKLLTQIKKECEFKEAAVLTKLEDVKKYYQTLVDGRDFRIAELESCKFTAPMFKQIVWLLVGTMAGWSLVVIFLIKFLW
jgi:hypothetical protein